MDAAHRPRPARRGAPVQRDLTRAARDVAGHPVQAPRPAASAPGWSAAPTTATSRPQACEELRPIIFGLAEWGARWAFGKPREDELDPTVLMWWIRGGIDPEPFGDRRVVLHVQLPEGRRTRFWFVIDPHDVSLCFTDPGHEVDLLLESELGTLYQMWEGVFELRSAHARRPDPADRAQRDLVLVFPEALSSPRWRPTCVEPWREPDRCVERDHVSWRWLMRSLRLAAVPVASPEPGRGRLPDRRVAVGTGLLPVRRLLGGPAAGADRPLRARRRGRRPVGAAGAGLRRRGGHGPARRAGRAPGRARDPDRPGPGRRDRGGLHGDAAFGGSVVNSELLALPFILAGLAAVDRRVVGAAPAGRGRVSPLLAGIAGTLAVLTKQSQLDVFVVALVLVLLTRRSLVLTGVALGALFTLLLGRAGQREPRHVGR